MQPWRFFADAVKHSFLRKRRPYFLTCNRSGAVQQRCKFVLCGLSSASLQYLCLPATTTILPIYSTSTSDINSLPRLARHFLPERKCVCVPACLSAVPWPLGVASTKKKKMLLMVMIFCFQCFVSPHPKKMRCENEKKKTLPSIELDSSLCFSSHQSCNILETEMQIGLKREAFWILVSTFHSVVCTGQPTGRDVWLYLSLRQWSKEKLQLTGTSCYGRKHRHAVRVGQTTCPDTLFQQPASLVVDKDDDTFLPPRAEVKPNENEGCFEFVSATWTDMTEKW